MKYKILIIALAFGILFSGCVSESPQQVSSESADMIHANSSNTANISTDDETSSTSSNLDNSDDTNITTNTYEYNTINTDKNTENSSSDKSDKSYSKEELMEIYEEEYNKNAKSIYVVEQLDDNIKMTVIKHGPFKTFNEFDVLKEYHRVDVCIENTNPDEKIRYVIMDASLVDENGNRYELMNGGTFEIGRDLEPHEQFEGYLLFENTPESSKFLTLEFKYGFINVKYVYIKLYN